MDHTRSFHALPKSRLLLDHSVRLQLRRHQQSSVKQTQAQTQSITFPDHLHTLLGPSMKSSESFSYLLHHTSLRRQLCTVAITDQNHKTMCSYKIYHYKYCCHRTRPLHQGYPQHNPPCPSTAENAILWSAGEYCLNCWLYLREQERLMRVRAAACTREGTSDGSAGVSSYRMDEQYHMMY